MKQSIKIADQISQKISTILPEEKSLKLFKKGVVGVIGITLLLLPLVIQSNYHVRILITIGIYVILASSLNIINGYAGQFSLGHAAFYGIGAYTAAILSTRYGFSFWLTLPLSGIVAIFFSLFLGVPTLRLRGTFLGISTLGFAEIVRLVTLNWIGFTRGPMGIPGIPFPSLLGRPLTSNTAYYYIVFALVLLMLYSSRRIIQSRIGRAWVAIREDETAARAIGIPTFRYKMLAFALASFWAGVAGAFYAHFASYISPDSFTLEEGFTHLAMVLVGGQGTLFGPILGASLLITLPELFRGLFQYRMVIYGVAIVLISLLRPQGLLGKGGER